MLFFSTVAAVLTTVNLAKNRKFYDQERKEGAIFSLYYQRNE